MTFLWEVEGDIIKDYDDNVLSGLVYARRMYKSDK